MHAFILEKLHSFPPNDPHKAAPHFFNIAIFILIFHKEKRRIHNNNYANMPNNSPVCTDIFDYPWKFGRYEVTVDQNIGMAKEE